MTPRPTSVASSGGTIIVLVEVTVPVSSW